MATKNKSLLSDINLILYIFLLASIVVILSSFLGLYKVTYGRGMIEREMERVQAAKEVLFRAEELKDMLHTYQNDRSTFYAKELKAKVILLDEKVTSFTDFWLKERADNPRELRYVKDLKQGMERLKGYLNTIGANGRVVQDGIRIDEELSTLLSRMDEFITTELSDLDLHLETSYLWLLSIMIFYIFVTLTGGVMVILAHGFSQKRFFKPLSDISDGIKRFVHGDRGVRLDIDSQDELGELSKRFNELAESVEKQESEWAEKNKRLERLLEEKGAKIRDQQKKLSSAKSRLLFTERLALAGELSSKLAHTILAPLSSIAVNMEVIQQCFSKNRCIAEIEQCTSSLKVMQEEVRRINALVDGYIKYSKLPSLKDRGPTCIEEVIDEAILLFFNKADKSGVKIEKYYSKTPKILLGRGEMREVFLNLGNNAIEAMEDGGILSFETSVEDDTVVVRVRDTGPGMDKKTLESLFIPFRSTKPAGLGLGLNIVKHIIESHGGRIACESELNKGTTFILFLPIDNNSANSLHEGGVEI